MKNRTFFFLKNAQKNKQQTTNNKKESKTSNDNKNDYNKHYAVSLRYNHPFLLNYNYFNDYVIQDNTPKQWIYAKQASKIDNRNPKMANTVPTPALQTKLYDFEPSLSNQGGRIRSHQHYTYGKRKHKPGNNRQSMTKTYTRFDNNNGNLEVSNQQPLTIAGNKHITGPIFKLRMCVRTYLCVWFPCFYIFFCFFVAKLRRFELCTVIS